MCINGVMIFTCKKRFTFDYLILLHDEQQKLWTVKPFLNPLLPSAGHPATYSHGNN